MKVGGYQQVDHVWLVVPQSFYSVKNVDAALLTQHLTHDTDTAEHTTATSAIPEEETGQRSQEKEDLWVLCQQLHKVAHKNITAYIHKNTPQKQKHLQLS